MKRRMALAVVALILHAGCQYFAHIVGRVRGNDGDTGIACTVAAFDGSWREDETRVILGERFTLLVSANRSRVYTLEVTCQGYERLFREAPVEACAGKWFSRCEVTDVGILVVTRLR